MSDERHNVYFDDADLDYFLQYALACQTYGGAAYGECLYAASQVRENDPATWVRAWTGTAARADAVGRSAEAAGHRVSARDAYLRAATYYAVALVCVRPREPRFAGLYRSFRAAFRRSAALHEPAFEPVAIPYDGGTLTGYFRPAAVAGVRRPAVVLLGDRFAEEMYVWGGAPAAAARGYHVLMADQPGQGLTPLDGLHTTAYAERPVGAMVDYVSALPGVSRVALYGVASAGYAVTRAAAADKRISACVAGPPVLDMGRLMRAETPTAPDPSGGGSAVRSVLFDLTAWQAGTTDLPGLFELFTGMRVDDAGGIGCPMLCLVSAGERPERVRQARELHGLLGHPSSALHVFTAEEGADAHNQANNLARAHQVVFDWLDEVLAVPAP